jgi:hypothetical protein
VPGTSRSRLTKLADKGIAAAKEAAKALRAEGKDATARAVAFAVGERPRQRPRWRVFSVRRLTKAARALSASTAAGRGGDLSKPATSR